MAEQLTFAKRTTLYTVKGAADELGVNVSRVHQLCRARGVGAYLGRQLVLTDREVDQLRERTPGRPRSQAEDAID